MHNIINVQPLANHKLKIKFENQKSFIFDVSPYLFGEIFEPLKNQNIFKNVKIDKNLGTIVWKNGADFCPDFLYKKMEEHIK